MSKSQATVGKKENEKKKARKRQDKLDKKEERRQNNNKGKGLEEMMAYLDENGNLTSTPPDPRRKEEINAADISLSPSQEKDPDAGRKGVVKFFNGEKGFGFIIDKHSKASIFFHINNLLEPVKEGDNVLFETERGPKGPTAVKVRKYA